MILRAFLGGLALFLSGCGHNLPLVDRPNSITDAAQARVYVDINGTLYPPNWRSPDVVGEEKVRRGHSIYAALNGNEVRINAVHAAEATHLAEITRLSTGRSRVFVFLVGFNTDQKSTAVELRAMQDAIGLSPEDLAIEFYWDGYDAAAVVDAARIWFWSTGSSQVAGQRGFRRVLNAVGDRPITIVSYSRGASVVLSALADPAYSPSYSDQTSSLTYLRPIGAKFFQPPPLAEGGDIHIIMLAPAIGQPDFWAVGSVKGVWKFRDFPKRVKSIRYSINPRDQVLNKGSIGLKGGFNPTDLGASQQGGAQLDCHYLILQGYPVVSEFGHDGAGYVRDASFTRMLIDSGVAIAGESAPSEAAPVVRRKTCR